VPPSQETREVGDANGSPRGAHDVLPRSHLGRLARFEAERLGQDVDVEPGIRNEADLVERRVPSQIRGRSECGEAARVDDGDAIAQRLGFVHGVGREEHGHAPLAQGAHELPGRGARVRVHTGGRLVEEHDTRAADERAREREALGLAPREPPHRGADGPAQPDEVEHRVGGIGVVVVRREQAQQLERAQTRVQAARLEHHAHLRAEATPVAHRIESEHAYRARVGSPVSLEDLDRGGLARAVGTEQAEHLAGSDLEVELVDRARRSVRLPESGHRDRGGAGDRAQESRQAT
jgi:hypothetical protein